MLLAIDTATRWASLALYDETGIISECNWRCLGNHTVEILPTLDLMLRRAGAQPSVLRAVAVARGPGSFTGLRIGMSVAKGLCLALNIPLLAVPTLDTIAYAVGDPGGPLYAVLELGRDRICAARYRFDNGSPVSEDPPFIGSMENWQIEAPEQVVVTGEINSELAEKLLRHAQAENIAISSLAGSARRAGYLAELAWQRLQEGESDDLDTTDPVYLHLPGSGTKTG
ncbi:MAG: tRNA (adenosine(37)-N6)-threonylcarbamoyltransferase complex dimerization subunit type 1 TsaB [Anaerolineae bacterium]